jgi:hypothetical protein
MQGHTAAELLAILSARQLKDGQVVFAGVGIPLLAATLAQRLRCPGLTILFEGGVIGAFVEPGKLPLVFSGQVKGSVIEGTIATGGAKSPWSATLMGK